MIRVAKRRPKNSDPFSQIDAAKAAELLDKILKVLREIERRSDPRYAHEQHAPSGMITVEAARKREADLASTDFLTRFKKTLTAVGDGQRLLGAAPKLPPAPLGRVEPSGVSASSDHGAQGSPQTIYPHAVAEQLRKIIVFVLSNTLNLNAGQSMALPQGIGAMIGKRLTEIIAGLIGNVQIPTGGGTLIIPGGGTLAKRVTEVIGGLINSATSGGSNQLATTGGDLSTNLRDGLRAIIKRIVEKAYADPATYDASFSFNRKGPPAPGAAPSGDVPRLPGGNIATEKQYVAPKERGWLDWFTTLFSIGTNRARRKMEMASAAFDAPEMVAQFGAKQPGFKGRATQALGNFMQGLDTGRGEEASELSRAGDMSKALGNLLGGVPLFGKPIEAATKFSDVLFKSVDKVQEWTQQLHDANMQFAEFSGAMAGVQARQEVREIELSRERGNRRAKSAEYLAEGKNQLDRSVAPIGDLVGNATNYVGGLLSRGFAALLSPVSWIAKKMQADGDDDKDIKWEEWEWMRDEQRRKEQEWRRPRNLRENNGPRGPRG